MKVNYTISVDVDDFIGSLSDTEKKKLKESIIDSLDDCELVEILRDRDCEWEEYGLKEE